MPQNLLKELLQFAKDYNGKEVTYAAALTKSGKVLTSVFVGSYLDSASLCAETGCIAESLKLKDPITHSLCIRFNSANGDWRILPACGLCRERLAQFGNQVMIGLPNPDKSDAIFKPLKEIDLYSWRDCI